MSRIKISDLRKPWAVKRLSGSPEEVFEKRKRIVVVTQDEKSSKYYLEALRRRMAVGAFDVYVESMPESPLKLVESVERRKAEIVGRLRSRHSRAKIDFDSTWVVFDKDGFDDFDTAVALAEDRGYGLGMSNECFELWYLLHFRDVGPDEHLPREVIFKELTEDFALGQSYERLKGAAGKEQIHVPMANEFFTRSIAFKRAVALAASNLKFENGHSVVKHSCTCIYKLLSHIAAQMPAAQQKDGAIDE